MCEDPSRMTRTSSRMTRFGGVFVTNRARNNITSEAHTHRLAEAASGLGVLSTHLQVPVVTQTAVRSTHHHPATAFYLIFFRRFRSSRRLAWRLLETTWRYFPVLLSVQEPLGDIELKRSVDHSNELLNLIVRQLTGTTQ